MKTNRTIAASFALVLIASAGLAGASPEKKQQRDSDVLRGPKVTDTTTRTQKKRDTMTEQVDRQNKQSHQRKGKEAKGKPGADRPIQFRDYVLALRGIKSRNANIAGLDLSDAQKDQIKMILEEQRQAMRTFHEQNKDRMKELRERIKNGDRADEAREKLRDFAANAGPTRDALAKLKQVLTPEQQTSLKSHIKAARQKRAQRPNQDQQTRRPGDRQRTRNLQTDAPQSDRRRTRTDRPQTDRPQADRPQKHRKGKPGQVRNTGPKSDKSQRHNKRSKPATKDD